MHEILPQRSFCSGVVGTCRTGYKKEGGKAEGDPVDDIAVALNRDFRDLFCALLLRFSILQTDLLTFVVPCVRPFHFPDSTEMTGVPSLQKR